MAYHASFLNGQTIGVDDLNLIMQNTLLPGITSGQCVVAKSSAPQQYTVSAGNVVFGNGVVMHWTDKQTVTLEKTGERHHVYAQLDVNKNCATLQCTLAPSKADTDSLYHVPLAEIDFTGNVTLLKQYIINRNPRKTPYYHVSQISFTAFPSKTFVPLGYLVNYAGYRFAQCDDGKSVYFVDLETQAYSDGNTAGATVGNSMRLCGVPCRFERMGADITMYSSFFSTNPNDEKTISFTIKLF